jgi:hypothetical protein
VEKKTGKTISNTLAQSRDERLKSALKANLRRRKAQAKARKVTDPDKS